MTITYQGEVATSRFFGFAKLLLKWRGSAYKLFYKEMLAYFVAFIAISLLYRHGMDDPQKRKFEKLSLYCSKVLDQIPLSFVLGFYVTFLVQRWWNQFTTMPWPDRTMNCILLYVRGDDERGRMIRRSLIRHLNLSFVMIMSSISVAVKKRFPTLDHLVKSGFMTLEEKDLFNNVNTKVNKYWVPMCWFINQLEEARKEKRIREGAPLKHILEELNNFRSKCALLWCFDWVTVPLVYTQVVTWATHLFCMACLIGRQFLDPEQGHPGHDIDLYIPVFTFLQLFFYLGWLKVAEQLINPFGEDDDDFETNFLIDRHIQVSYLIADNMFGKLPKLGKDVFWNNDKIRNIPYTEASKSHKIAHAYKGSAMNIKIPKDQAELFERDDSDDEKTKSTGFLHMNKKRKSLWHRVSSIRQNQQEPVAAETKVRSLGKKESLLGGTCLAELNAVTRKRSMDELDDPRYTNLRNSHASAPLLHAYDERKLSVDSAANVSFEVGSLEEGFLQSPTTPNGFISNLTDSPRLPKPRHLSRVSESDNELDNIA